MSTPIHILEAQIRELQMETKRQRAMIDALQERLVDSATANALFVQLFKECATKTNAHAMVLNKHFTIDLMWAECQMQAIANESQPQQGRDT